MTVAIEWIFDEDAQRRIGLKWKLLKPPAMGGALPLVGDHLLLEEPDWTRYLVVVRARYWLSPPGDMAPCLTLKCELVDDEIPNGITRLGSLR